MAEGFLQQTRGKAFEDIGDEYFNYLLSISLLQDVERDWLGCITSCKMHDFVHDLALSIRNSEISGTFQIQQQTAYDGARLWHSFFSKSSLFDVVADFKGLRVLSFCDADISSLPESIGRLKRLRYLDISNTDIDRLPKSITQLYLLQTLRLLSCNSLEKLPEGMKKLVSLKHLYIDDKSHVLSEIGCLTGLQTLPIFDVDTKRGCGIGELRCLNEVGGKLEISNLQYVRNKEEAQRAKIWEKKKLHSLKLEWIYGREGEVSKDDEQVLEGLEPHSNLKSLTIENYNGECCPSWLVIRKSGSPSASNFQPMNLLKLKLIDCKKLKNLPTDLGLFTKLKFLKIEGLANVKCIGKEFYINNNNDGDKNKCNTLFPCLEKFTLRGIREVKEWVVDVEPTIRVFPCLKELTIEACPNLSSVPVMSRFSSLETLIIGSCDELTWIGDADADGVFPSSLKVLNIWWCSKLRSIPSVEAEGGMSSLEKLNVVGCDELREIEEGLLASSTCLRDVRIQYCPNLISIPSIQGCSSLSRLTLLGCKGLTSLPSIQGCSSLLSLTLDGCKGLTSLPSGLRTSTSLQRLSITNCNSLKSIPEDILSLGCLTHLKTLELGPFSEELEEFPGLTSIHHLHSSLQSLTLYGWEKLSSLPHQRQHLTALETLEIRDFGGVKAFPAQWLGNLSNLKTLSLGPFSEEMEEFPDLHLPSPLQTLNLYGWQKLSSLPHQLQQLTSLEYLWIEKFSGVKALPEWLVNLSSLRSLEIDDCENLEHLPSEEAMQRLSNLHMLSIYHCPRLKGNSAERS